MQKITLTTLLTCILLNSCATHTKKELPIVPEIKYALSGGAEEKIPHLAPNSYPMYSDDSIYYIWYPKLETTTTTGLFRLGSAMYAKSHQCRLTQI